MKAGTVCLPYTVQQIAEMTKLSETTIRKEIKSGRLKARHKRGQVKRWYITQSDLDEWANGGMLEDADE